MVLAHIRTGEVVAHIVIELSEEHDALRFLEIFLVLRAILALMPTTVPKIMRTRMTKSELTRGASIEAQPSQWNIDSILSLKEWDVALVTLS